MKLREVVKAISGFKYLVLEYDVFSNGKVSKTPTETQCNHTEMRCLQFNKHHERQINGQWWVIGRDEFNFLLKKNKNNVIVRRKGKVVQTKVSEKKPLDFIDMTKHFMERVSERFNRDLNRISSLKFVNEVFQDHIVVQGAEFYNTFRDHDPSDAYIYSKVLNAILVVHYRDSMYVLITAYRASDTKWFLNWFQDNMHRLNEFPTIGQFFGFNK